MSCSKPVRDAEAALPTASRAAAGSRGSASRLFREPTTPTLAACKRPAITHQISATSAILVRLANWLRWRRLAKASPNEPCRTHGSSAAARPKYCSRPIRLLTRPAATSAQANGPAQRCANVLSSGRSDAMRRAAPSPSSPPVAISAINHGSTGGDGPGANGLSQGSVSRKKAVIE